MTMSSKSTMTSQQFDAIAKLLRAKKATMAAAREVLVLSKTNVWAAKKYSMSSQSVSNAVTRIRRAHELISSVYVMPSSKVVIDAQSDNQNN